MIPSVEMQGIIQRSHDVTQIKAYEDARPEQQHSNIVMNQEKNVVEQHETVVKQDNADKKRKENDAREKTHGIYYKIGKKGEKHKPEDDGIVIKKNSGFDVKI